MPYTVLTTAPAHKMLKKFPPQIHEHLTDEALRLANDPQLGEQLTGALRSFRSPHTKLDNVHYRIVYEIDDRNRRVIIRAIGERENFYKRLQKMKLKSAA